MTGRYLPDQIETPCVVIDVAKVQNNINRAQTYFDDHGIKFRPHIKTHKLSNFAQRQIDAGAVGITCQKLGEAEIMAENGIEDILITYNILGAPKLERLRCLSDKCRLSVVADSEFVIRGLAEAFATSASQLTVLVECDTGQGRCGVQSPEQAFELALLIEAMPGLNFGGLMTYPPKKKHHEVDQFLQRAARLCENDGLVVPHISNGGSPELAKSHLVTSATEHRSGTYIYNDRSLVQSGDCSFDDCALTIHATVVSRPTPNRMIIDAGSKVLTSDTMGLSGFGHIVEFPDARIIELHEEHGIVDLTACGGGDGGNGGGGEDLVMTGDTVQIIPNHACVVSNLFDVVFLKHPDGSVEAQNVACRGQVW